MSEDTTHPDLEAERQRLTDTVVRVIMEELPIEHMRQIYAAANCRVNAIEDEKYQASKVRH